MRRWCEPWWIDEYLDGVQGIEKLHLVKLEDELSEYLFPQERGFLATVEEDHAKEPMVLPGADLAHDQLEVVDIELALQQLVFGRRVLPARHLAHILLAAGLAASLLFALLELNFVFALSPGHYFFEGPLVFSLAQASDIAGQVEGSLG